MPDQPARHLDNSPWPRFGLPLDNQPGPPVPRQPGADNGNSPWPRFGLQDRRAAAVHAGGWGAQAHAVQQPGDLPRRPQVPDRPAHLQPRRVPQRPRMLGWPAHPQPRRVPQRPRVQDHRDQIRPRQVPGQNRAAPGLHADRRDYAQAPLPHRRGLLPRRSRMHRGQAVGRPRRVHTPGAVHSRGGGLHGHQGLRRLVQQEAAPAHRGSRRQIGVGRVPRR